mgnify:FL=1
MIRHHYKDVRSTIAEREAFVRAIIASCPVRSVLISTCDRVELYEDDGDGIYECDAAIVRHLYRVVSGLESPFLGEHMIIHQVKQAYRMALENDRSSGTLNILFQNALRVGKYVRANTEIARGAISHAHATVALLRREIPSLTGMRVTFVGVNDLIETMIRYLVKYELPPLCVVNRTYEKAIALALRHQGTAYPLSALTEVLLNTDILIAATSSPTHIVNTYHIPQKEMIIIDLGMPRNVEPSVVRCPGVRVFTVNDVERIAKESSEQRALSVTDAEDIIERETDVFTGLLQRRRLMLGEQRREQRLRADATLRTGSVFRNEIPVNG